MTQDKQRSGPLGRQRWSLAAWACPVLEAGEPFLAGYRCASLKCLALVLSPWRQWEEKEKVTAWGWDEGLRQEMLPFGNVDTQEVRAECCINSKSEGPRDVAGFASLGSSFSQAEWSVVDMRLAHFHCPGLLS